MDMTHYPHGGIDKTVSENTESAKAEVVYKLVADVQIIQKFVKDFLNRRRSQQEGQIANKIG